MKKIFLRELITEHEHANTTELSIFKGDIKENKKYFEQYHKNVSVRYFKLEEFKKNQEI